MLGALPLVFLSGIYKISVGEIKTVSVGKSEPWQNLHEIWKYLQIVEQPVTLGFAFLGWKGMLYINTVDCSELINEPEHTKVMLCQPMSPLRSVPISQPGQSVQQQTATPPWNLPQHLGMAVPSTQLQWGTDSKAKIQHQCKHCGLCSCLWKADKGVLISCRELYGICCCCL